VPEWRCDGYGYTTGNSKEVRDGVSPSMSENRTRNNGLSMQLDAKSDYETGTVFRGSLFCS